MGQRSRREKRTGGVGGGSLEVGWEGRKAGCECPGCRKSFVILTKEGSWKGIFHATPRKLDPPNYRSGTLNIL